jgi:hypothetical protein
MGLYLLHICEGEHVVADAGFLAAAEATTAIAAGVLVAKELAADLRFVLSAVVVTDDTSNILARVPVWRHAQARQADPEDEDLGSGAASESPCEA